MKIGTVHIFWTEKHVNQPERLTWRLRNRRQQHFIEGGNDFHKLRADFLASEMISDKTKIEVL